MDRDSFGACMSGGPADDGGLPADTAVLKAARTKAPPGPVPTLTQLFGEINKGRHSRDERFVGTESNGILGFFDLSDERQRFRDDVTVACNGTSLKLRPPV
jgi:hypothetical protein